jgi:hypothetical protein
MKTEGEIWNILSGRFEFSVECVLDEGEKMSNSRNRTCLLLSTTHRGANIVRTRSVSLLQISL